MLTSRGKYVQRILQAFRFASLANQNGCRMNAGEKLLHLKFLGRNSEHQFVLWSRDLDALLWLRVSALSAVNIFVVCQKKPKKRRF